MSSLYQDVVYYVLIRYCYFVYYLARSYRLQPNIEFTLRRELTVFTRLAVTPPKVNRFG